MKIIQLISIKFEMKNIGIIVYGRFPTEKAYGSHVIDIADGFLENNCNVNVFYSKTSRVERPLAWMSEANRTGPDGTGRD